MPDIVSDWPKSVRSRDWHFGSETSKFRDFYQFSEGFGFCFGEFGLGKKVSVSIMENLISKKKFRFRRTWSWKKSIGFGEFGLGKKVCRVDRIIFFFFKLFAHHRTLREGTLPASFLSVGNCQSVNIRFRSVVPHSSIVPHSSVVPNSCEICNSDIVIGYIDIAICYLGLHICCHNLTCNDVTGLT